MHRIFCTAYIYDLEQKAAYLAQKIPHFLHGHAQTEFYNAMHDKTDYVIDWADRETLGSIAE